MSMKTKWLVLTGACWLGLQLAVPCGHAAGEAKPIKIGAIFSVTGPASFLGAPESKTAKMFVDKINAGGGLLGRPIELIIKDSAGSPEKAVSFAKQLIEEDQVLAIIGPSTSGETMQIKKLCEESQMILSPAPPPMPSSIRSPSMSSRLPRRTARRPPGFIAR
jgi:ABC-type branched-subunit amino acid transport system substrate-binding protein